MWQTGSICYGTKTEAIAAAVSHRNGEVVELGGLSHVLRVTQIGPDGVQYTFSPISGGVDIIQFFGITPPPCGLLTWHQGAAIATAIAVAWISIDLIARLRRIPSHEG